jgi:hypothetical protein
MIGTKAYDIVAPNEADAVEWGRRQDSIYGSGQSFIHAIDLDEAAKRAAEQKKAEKAEEKPKTHREQRIEKKNARGASKGGER